MDATHVDAALASLTALIVEAAQSSDVKRFQTIVDLCRIADRMARMRAQATGTRVRDFPRPEQHGFLAPLGEMEPIELGGAQYIQGGVGALHGGDQGDMLRQLVMGSLPMLQGLQVQAEGRVRTDRARELDVLVGTLGDLRNLKDDTNAEKIQKRVDALIAAMEKEETGQHNESKSTELLLTTTPEMARPDGADANSNQQEKAVD